LSKKSIGGYGFLIKFVIKWNKLPFIQKYRSISVKFIPIINKLPARLKKEPEYEN